MENKKEQISYSELARRVGDCVLNNTLMGELQGDGYDFEIVNGSDSYCYKHETQKECDKHSEKCEFESREVYQTFIITQSAAGYLDRNTDEIVYHCDKLDIYLWRITHFGTGWDCVFTSINKN